MSEQKVHVSDARGGLGGPQEATAQPCTGQRPLPPRALPSSQEPTLPARDDTAHSAPGAAQLQPAQPIAAPWPRSYTQPGEELEPGPDLSSPNPLLHDGCRLPLRQTSSVYDNTV